MDEIALESGERYPPPPGFLPPSTLSPAFASAVRSAAIYGDPLIARSLHAQTIRRLILPNAIVSTSLISMYSKCGELGFARTVFDHMRFRNAITWNAMLAAYVSCGMVAAALRLFCVVKRDLKADEFTVSSGFTACAVLNDLRSGQQIHGFSVRSGFEIDPVVVKATAKMYFKCGEVSSAERVMEGKENSLLSIILIVKGYMFNEKYADAVRMINQKYGFVKLFLEDDTIAVSVLSAAAILRFLRTGKQVHGVVLISGYHRSSCAVMMEKKKSGIYFTALIDMYSKCFSIADARLVFDHLTERDVSHWNALMAGLIQKGLLEEASKLFEEMPCKNLISWTSLISGYVLHGSPRRGLETLAKMYKEESSVRANSFTFSTSLDACSSLAAFEEGRQIHAQMLRTLNEENMVVDTALVDMYCRSGSLVYAQRIFDRMQFRNAVSWTSMITGYASHGHALEAIEAFEKMMRKGIVPTEVTFVSVFTACSHGGMIEKGMEYFKMMKEKYGIAYRDDHFACLVDMLGRAGKLGEAEKVLKGGNGEDGAMWGALLGGCVVHGDVEMGSRVAEEMISRRHQISGTFVALSNMHASLGNWDDVCDVRGRGRKERITQKAGHSAF